MARQSLHHARIQIANLFQGELPIGFPQIDMRQTAGHRHDDGQLIVRSGPLRCRLRLAAEFFQGTSTAGGDTPLAAGVTLAQLLEQGGHVHGVQGRSIRTR